jgi:branched-chain amino acid transport system substrate-binding protein
MLDVVTAEQGESVRIARRWWRLLVPLTVLALVVAACGGTPTEDAAGAAGAQDGGDELPPAEGTSLPPGTYKVGLEAVTSGPAAFGGVPAAQGARLAVAEANDSEGLGADVVIELLEQDSGGDPARSLAAMDRFLSEGISGIVCCVLSAAASSMKPQLQEEGVPAVLTSALLPDLPEPPHIYRTFILLADTAYREIIGGVVRESGAETAIMAVTADNDGMVVDSEHWVAALNEHGVELLQTADTRTGDTDFAGPATGIIDSAPDVVVLSMTGEEATLLTQSLRARGYEGEIVTTYGISNDANYRIAGEALAGVKFPTAFTTESPYPEAQEFIAAYEEAYGEEPDVFAAAGYSAMRLLLEGLRTSGDGTAGNVAEALARVEQLDTVFGPVRYEDGQAVLDEPALLVEWQADGSFEIWEP